MTSDMLQKVKEQLAQRLFEDAIEARTGDITWENVSFAVRDRWVDKADAVFNLVRIPNTRMTLGDAVQAGVDTLG